MTESILQNNNAEDAVDMVLRLAAYERQRQLCQELEALPAPAEPLDLARLDARVEKEAGRLLSRPPRPERQRRLLLAAVIILSLLILCPTAAYAFSPAFRERVQAFFMNWGQGNVDITFYQPERDEGNAGPMNLGTIILHYFPEGFELVDQIGTRDQVWLFAKGDEFLRIFMMGDNFTLSVDTEYTEIDESYMINGSKAIVSINESINGVIWTYNGEPVRLSTSLPVEEALKIAENLEILPEPLGNVGPMDLGAIILYNFPKGFELVERSGQGARGMWIFERGEEYLRIFGLDESGVLTTDTEYTETREVGINDSEAIISLRGNIVSVVWTCDGQPFS